MKERLMGMTTGKRQQNITNKKLLLNVFCIIVVEYMKMWSTHTQSFTLQQQNLFPCRRNSSIHFFTKYERNFFSTELLNIPEEIVGNCEPCDVE